MLRVRAEARSAVPFDQLEIVASGRMVAAQAAASDHFSASIEAEVATAGPIWLAARCWGKGPLPAGCGGPWVYAHTSPVYVDVEGRRLARDTASAEPLLEVLEHTMRWLAQSARCPTQRHREHLAEVLQSARQELLRRQEG